VVKCKWPLMTHAFQSQSIAAGPRKYPRMPVSLHSVHCLCAADVEEALLAIGSYLLDTSSSRLRSLSRHGPFVWISANAGEYDFSKVVFDQNSYQITNFPNDSAEFCHHNNVRDSADACTGVL
jgi:hypothetical protein